jgi:hypothetical protein
VAINGINQFLSGVNGDRSQDFWTNGFTIAVPGPASLMLLGLGILGAAVWQRQRGLRGR